MEEKNFIIGTTGQHIDAYEQAVTEGLVDPKKVSRKEFEAKANRENYGTFDIGYHDELIRSAHNVAKIMKRKKG